MTEFCLEHVPDGGLSYCQGEGVVKQPVRIDEYLVEDSLVALLEIMCDLDGGGDDRVERQAKVHGTRMRYDAKLTHQGKPYVVEFDGDLHFRDANVMYRDALKDAAMRQAGVTVVRVPYFVQLNSDTFKALFGFDFPIPLRTTYPHGFIASKMTPASFCKLGLARYESILSCLPAYVVADIEKSLQAKIASGLPPDFVL